MLRKCLGGLESSGVEFGVDFGLFGYECGEESLVGNNDLRNFCYFGF